MRWLILLPFLAATGCLMQSQNGLRFPEQHIEEEPTGTGYPENSWPSFLQNLPAREGAILDYTGTPVNDQTKHVSVLTYDVGTKDLQQCADALIRLRAEYLFQQKQYEEIRFHFTSGHLYRYPDYCKGLRPVLSGYKVSFRTLSPTAMNHSSLRNYLDIVYAYAGTISLAKELKATRELAVGTVIIKGGSPGHCSIIVDEATNKQGKKVYKLAEGYTPAQSIYILKNPVDGSPWHQIKAGAPIHTSTYSFTNYLLGRFE